MSLGRENGLYPDRRRCVPVMVSPAARPKDCAQPANRSRALRRYFHRVPFEQPDLCIHMIRLDDNLRFDFRSYLEQTGCFLRAGNAIGEAGKDLGVLPARVLPDIQRYGRAAEFIRGKAPRRFYPQEADIPFCFQCVSIHI